MTLVWYFIGYYSPTLPGVHLKGSCSHMASYCIHEDGWHHNFDLPGFYYHLGIGVYNNMDKLGYCCLIFFYLSPVGCILIQRIWI